MQPRSISVSNQYFARAAERLREGTSVRLLVRGNSMLPFIHGGKDQVTLVPFDGRDLPLGIAALHRGEKASVSVPSGWWMVCRMPRTSLRGMVSMRQMLPSPRKW